MTTDHNCTDHSIPTSRDATECLICRGRELAYPDTLVAIPAVAPGVRVGPDVIDRLRENINGAEMDMAADAEDAVETGERVDLAPYEVAVDLEDAKTILAALDTPTPAMGELVDALRGLLAAYSKPDERLCCDGHECGCQGATVQMQAEYYARAVLAKIGGE
jgi:hypothetical protein